MKLHLHFLLLFAVASTTVWCDSVPESSAASNGAQSNAQSSNAGTINLSMDVTADNDEASDSRESESKPSESAQYATYQTAPSSVSAVPEFGMRNPKPQSETHSQDYEPSISAAYKNQHLETSSSQVVQREFVPSVYRMTDTGRKPIFESYNSQSNQDTINAQESTANEEREYGQAQSVPNEADSPYYSKSQQEAGQDQAGGQTESGFTPLGMSVEDAFRKYFPPRKEEEEQQQQSQPADAGYSNQQEQGQQEQRQPQFITTYTETTEQPPLPPSPSPRKEIFSIDSLREIVEKQPLARPDPFDPPSPPLSAFLPPQEGAVQSTQQTISPIQHQPQHTSTNEAQNSIHHQIHQAIHYRQQQQLLQQQQMIQDQQQLLQHQQQPQEIQSFTYNPQAQSNYVYAKVQPEQIEAVSSIQQASNTAPNPVQSQSLVAQHQLARPGVDEPGNEPADSEDEGLAYNTENLDEDGKKVSYIYSRPVRLPDMTRTKLVDDQGREEIQEHVHYRKPVSYENEEDSPDAQGGPNLGGEGDLRDGPRGHHEGQMLTHQPMSIGAYPDQSQQRQPQHQWNSGPSDNRPNFADPSQKGPDDSGRPQNIEYGGFVPIKSQSGPGASFGGPLPPQQLNQNEPYLERPNPPPYDLPPQGNGGDGGNFVSFQENRGPQQYQQQSGGPNFGESGPNGNFGEGGPGSNGNFIQQQPQQGQQQQGEQRPPPGHNKNHFGHNFFSRLPHMRFRPLYGRDAMKKLRELGISEDEFYGTVNKILKNGGTGANGGNGPRGHGENGPRGPGGNGPLYKGPLPYLPKANLYRSPPKNGHRGPMFGNNKMRPLGNTIEEFEFNYLKDGLPPGASYNPRDVGLDESVLAQIQFQDSGIGGYRFPTMIPSGSLNVSPPKQAGYRTGRFGFKKAPKLEGPPLPPPPPPPQPQGAGPAPYQQQQMNAMNSMAMPFVLAGPRPFGAPRRIPYSATGKGFRSQYGYRAAASELKPQFALPKPVVPKPFAKLLGAGGQPLALSSANVSPLLGLDDSHMLGNIFGIRSIKGIKSLVSYLTGGVSG